MNDIDTNSITEDQIKYLSKLNELFVRNKVGKEILEVWEKFYIYRNICIEDCPVESAKRDGENRFIRNLLCNIERFKIINEEKK